MQQEARCNAFEWMIQYYMHIAVSCMYPMHMVYVGIYYADVKHISCWSTYTYLHCYLKTSIDFRCTKK